ncbi:hypothetical protein NDU88_005166 [Pleurodeles waltl]|uniref:Secreted protein n=1 Tax=Pleurodeles waltl TaxID=8319 RepID=A0AAV7TA71_PLEWA|nr:hypothetical protein NDU88_005166 [Pleurodeles waltl]
MRCLCTALLYALLYVAHSRSTHGHDTGHRSHLGHLGRLSHLGTLGLRYSSGALSGFWLFLVPRPRRSPHRYSEPAQLRAPRGAGEETGSSPGHACLLTEAHGNCSPRASSYSPRTMHLGAEQQPPTAPATEAAHPAFPASRAVFRGCFPPASSGRHRLAAAAANRVPDAHLALVVSSRDASHPAPASTSVVCRTPLSSSLVSSLLFTRYELAVFASIKGTHPFPSNH